jgi:hypothetical protein
VRTAFKLPTVIALVCLLSACGPTKPETIVERIPIKVQKTVVVEVYSLTGPGTQEVGILCPTQAWQALTNSSDSIKVELLSSDSTNTQVFGIGPDMVPLISADAPGAHYIFSLSGKGKATVRIIFPNAPADISDGQIVVCEPVRLSL